MWYYQVERQLALLFFEKNNNYEGPRVPTGTGVFGAFASYLTLISLSSFFLQSLLHYGLQSFFVLLKS